MSIGLGDTRSYTGAIAADLNATADILTLSPQKPLNVVRFGFLVGSATASGTTLVVSLDKVVVSTGTRTEIATLKPTATVTTGKGLYFNLTTNVPINPGEQVIVEVKTAAGVAATGMPFIEATEYPFQPGARTANMTLGTGA